MNLNAQIGSILEGWLLEGVTGACQFCREDLGPDDDTVTKGELVFCSEECREDWMTVQEARLVLGKRDLEQRGFD